MKKLFAILLAVLLVLLNVAALADENDEPEIPLPTDQVNEVEAGGEESGDTPAAEPSLKKTVTSNATGVYPAETLEFTVTPENTEYPTVTVGTNNTFVMDGSTNEYTIDVNVPEATAYPEAGKYHYTVVETATQTDPSQGETYSTKTFNVDVWVYYDENGAKTKKVNVYSGTETDGNADETAKTDVFENTYEVYELTVGKEITGNLADPTQEFTIVVTLTADNTIANDLVIDDSHATSVTGDVEKGATSYTITVTAIGGQSATISNIPKGTKYTVAETTTAGRIQEDNATAQMAAANNPLLYYVTGEVTEATELSANASVTITNKKDITIPTGIALDTVPYAIILAIALFGLVKMAARRRKDF